ncbi:MAG: acetylornithine deacetylase [Gammaproteobacteria bacterium]
MPLPASSEMVAELVRTPSISCFDPALDTSNRAVCATLGAFLEDAGARVTLQEVPGARDKVNLLARFGSGPPGLALCGHTDTVPFDDARWTVDPFAATTRDHRLYGLGSADMKGFLAICASVLAQHNANALTREIIVLGSADEETSMAGARALVDSGATLAPFAVVGEPTSLRPMRQHKGIFMEGIRLLGRSGHSSNPALGANAIDALHAVLSTLMQWRDELRDRFHDVAFDVPHPTLNFGRVEGGDNPNRICANASLQIDMRLMPGMTVNDTRRGLHQRVREAIHGSGVQVEFDSLFAGVEPLCTAADSDLVTQCEGLSGHTASCVNFGTEAPFYTTLGAQSVVFGPGDIDLAHQPDEYLDLTQIAPTERALSALVHHYCGPDAKATP